MGIGPSESYVDVLFDSSNSAIVIAAPPRKRASIPVTSDELNGMTIILRIGGTQVNTSTLVIGSSHADINFGLSRESNHLWLLADHTGSSQNTNFAVSLAKCIVYGFKNSSSGKTMQFCGVPMVLQFGTTEELAFFDAISNSPCVMSGGWTEDVTSGTLY